MHRLFLAAALLLPLMAHAQQDSKLTVAPGVMAAHCVTEVSPRNTGVQSLSVVVVRVFVSATGKAMPVSVVSGAPALQAEAMDAIRLWRYKPFLRDGNPVDVMTEVRVIFEPGKPGGMVSHPNR